MTELPQPGDSTEHLRGLFFHRILNTDYRIPSKGAAAAVTRGQRRAVFSVSRRNWGSQFA